MASLRFRFRSEAVAGWVEEIQISAELMQTQATLDELLSGSREQEVAEARAILERVQSEYEKARRDWVRAERKKTSPLHNMTSSRPRLTLPGPRQNSLNTIWHFSLRVLVRRTFKAPVPRWLGPKPD